MDNKLTQGNVYKTLAGFAVPFLLANLLQVLYGAADMLVVGQFAQTADVSAVSIGSQIMMMLTHVVLGLSTGATVLLGQFCGAKRERDMAKTVGASVWLFAGIAVILTAGLLVFRDWIIAVMNTPPEAVGAAKSYLLICSLGMIFIVGYNIVSGILRGMGDSKTPLLFVAVACIINIAVDIVLVGGVHLGAAGAAAATVLAQAVSFLFALLFLRHKGLGFQFRRQDVRFSADFISKIFTTGAPLALQNALVGISFLLITLVINKMGLVASAAVGVVEKLIEFLMLPSAAFSAAVAAMAAQNFGAQKFDRAKKCMYAAVVFCFIFGVLVALFCQFRGELLTAVFTKEGAVITAAAQYLQTYALDCVLVAFIFNMNGYFNGAGYAAFSMTHSLIAAFAIRIPATLIFSRMPDVTLKLLGCAAPLSSLGSVFFCVGFLFWLSRRPDRLEEKFRTFSAEHEKTSL